MLYLQALNDENVYILKRRLAGAFDTLLSSFIVRSIGSRLLRNHPKETKTYQNEQTDAPIPQIMRT